MTHIKETVSSLDTTQSLQPLPSLSKLNLSSLDGSARSLASRLSSLCSVTSIPLLRRDDCRALPLTFAPMHERAHDRIGKEFRKVPTELHSRKVAPAVASHISPETSPIVRRHDHIRTILLGCEFTLAFGNKSEITGYSTRPRWTAETWRRRKRNDNARAQACFSREASYAPLEKSTSCDLRSSE